MEAIAADLQTVLEALGELENGAIYIAVGLFLYLALKIAAPSFVVLKVAKYIRDWAITTKSVTEQTVVKLDDMIISHDDTGDWIREAVRAMRRYRGRVGYSSNYLHSDGAKEIHIAVQQYIERQEREANQ